MAACRRALAMSENQRETRHICLYEIGNYKVSHHLPDRLNKEVIVFFLSICQSVCMHKNCKAADKKMMYSGRNMCYSEPYK